MSKNTPEQQLSHPPTFTEATGDRTPDSNARKGGLSLILTALATGVAVGGRVAAGADQPTLAESLVVISESSGLYAIGGAGRLISGVALVAGAWFLSKTWIIRERRGTSRVPALFAVSGLFTILSGACAVALAASGPEATLAVETTAYLRWLTGTIGFTAAGLALMLAARYQWKTGGPIRYIAPLSAVIGIAMQFIWIDGATGMHQISGVTFTLWLLAIGAMLVTGRVERHFAAMPKRDSAAWAQQTP